MDPELQSVTTREAVAVLRRAGYPVTESMVQTAARSSQGLQDVPVRHGRRRFLPRHLDHLRDYFRRRGLAPGQQEATA